MLEASGRPSWIQHDNPLQLRHGLDDLLEALVQPGLLRADFAVGQVAQDLVDLGDGALDRLEHLQRMLVQDIERAFDALIGRGLDLPVIDPRREHEQHRGQHQRGHHHQFQETDR